MIRRCFSLAAVIAIGLLVAGCYTDFGPVVAQPAPLPATIVTTHFQVGDRATVTIYDEPNLSGVYDVTPAGVMVLPLIGAVRAVGKTRTELEQEIADRYSRGKFLQEPKVTVDVIEYRPVYIFGEVEKPGPIPYRSGLNALTAITTAGGLTYRGSREVILIQRAGEQVWKEYPLTSAITVMPGDLIRVPERYF